MKGQIHIHTTYSDGALSPQEAAEIYEARGFDFIAITDHDHLLKKGYREAVSAVKANLIVFFGIELTLRTRWGYVHVARIEGDSEVLYVFNHPADYGFSPRETLECIHAISIDYPIHAVEISRQGFYTPQYDTDSIPYPKVAADDAHRGADCGRAWIELESTPSKDQIIRQIKRGKVRCRFARGGYATASSQSI